jgi:hypothetical protein
MFDMEDRSATIRIGGADYRLVLTTRATKGDNISFQTPTIEGTVMRRNKPDANGKHPWKSEITEGDAGIKAETVQQWFASVYEPAYNVEQPEPEVRRQPEFDNGQPV